MTPRDFSVDTMLRANAVRHAGRDAVVDPTMRLSWTELDARVERLAQALLAWGIGPGDRIALLLVDGAAFLELFYAAGTDRRGRADAELATGPGGDRLDRRRTPRPR